jgi:hypothetical protein
VSLQAAALLLLSFWLVVLSIESCKTGIPSTPCFLSKAGPEGLLSKKNYLHRVKINSELLMWISFQLFITWMFIT